MMLYMIFKYGLEPVLIQRILIGLKAILEKIFLNDILKIFYLIDLDRELSWLPMGDLMLPAGL